jgi:hypothetical protein
MYHQATPMQQLEEAQHRNIKRWLGLKIYNKKNKAARFRALEQSAQHLNRKG